MHAAAAKGDVKQLEQCLQQGTNVDKLDEYIFGSTPLMRASAGGHREAVAFLIARKANVNHTDAAGEFALLQAAINGHQTVCEALLRAGAHKSKNFRAKTAAQWAKDKGFSELGDFLLSWFEQVCVLSFVRCVSMRV